MSNVRYAGTDARQAIGVLGGYRFTLADFNFGVGAAWYIYLDLSWQPGQLRLNYAEGVVKATCGLGQVTLLGTVAGSPNFFGSSGTGICLEGGADWHTGFQDIVPGERGGHQWIGRNPRFGKPDHR